MSDNAGATSTGGESNGGLFSWILPALKSRRTLKTWFRCCVALAATMILMVDNKTLGNLGQAGFFGAIITVMLPPSLALSLFIFAAVTLLLGMLVGWAWGAAAMVSALSVRNQALLAQQQQEAQASLVQGIPVALQFQKFIFQGKFLDPRSSAVYGAFFFIGTFALGTLRAYIPKLALLSIFGSIVLDITCSYGPLFPTAQYTLSKLFIIPTAYYVAIAIAALVVIFPESLNRIWLTTLLDEFLAPTSTVLAIQSEALLSNPSDGAAWSALTDQGYAERESMIAGTQALLGQIPMIDLEFSVGRLGPADLKRISGELKSLLIRAAGLQAFQIFVHNSNRTHQTSGPKADRYAVLQHKIREREAQYGHDLDSLVPLLERSSANLRGACAAALAGTTEWLEDCNSGRWKGFLSRIDEAKIETRRKKLVGKAGELRMALDEFRRVERVELVKPFERFFDPVTGERIKQGGAEKKDSEAFAAKSLFICFVFLYAIDAFSARLLKFLDLLVELDGKRPKARLWAPSGFGKLGRKLMSRGDLDKRAAPLAMGTASDPRRFSEDVESVSSDEEGVAEEEVTPHTTQTRNPNALPPRTAAGRFFKKMAGVFRFFKSPEGIFGLRHAAVSVALWVPSVCQESAWFYYGNRGIWALIMAQTALAVYAGDQIAGFFVRLGGTALGLLVGMAVWYIGAGTGDGNPYGIVVATTVFVAPFLLGRLAAPAQQMMFWTMTGVTIVFIVGYSWINRHLPVLVSSGVGVGLGWKRALLVIIGFTAAFIVMLFPRPTSSRTLVRETLAATTMELGHVLAEEFEALLAEEARLKKGYHEKVEFVGEGGGGQVSAKERRVRAIARRVLEVAERLQDLKPSLQTARFEPQLQGRWPHEKYEQLHALQMKFLSSLVLFASAFSHLDTKWCSILVHRTPFLNPNLLSDIFCNISILSSALAGAHPLPASLIKLRDRVVYHETFSAHLNTRAPKSQPKSHVGSDLEDSDSEDIDIGVGEIDGLSIGFEDVSLDILMDEQLPAHATALVALSNLLSLIDEMSATIKELCGATMFRGFDELQRDFIGREERIIGTGFFPR